jgi:ribonuclease P protein component
LIARVRQRQTFQRLTREGVRIRRSTLWCTWCPQSDSTEATGPAVAFAIGRAVGPAVARNRLRRRLRELLAELDSAEPLPPITMLLGATPAAAKLTFDQLRSELRQLLDPIRASGAPPTG